MLSSVVKQVTRASISCLKGKSAVQTRAFHRTASLLSDGMSPTGMHTYTEVNNEDTPWDFTKENYGEIKKILARYPSNKKQSGCLPLLHLAQVQNKGWIPLAAMNKIAQVLEIPPMKVYEVATFYAMYNRTPVGRYHIQVCVTSPCMIMGSDDIVAALEKHLGIHLFETTSDGMFTLGEMECMGCCVNAPMIVVSDYSSPELEKFTYDFYEDLTVERTIEIVEAFRRGEKPTPGPQNGRKNAMAKPGKTSLLGEPAGPFCRDLTPPAAAAAAPQK